MSNSINTNLAALQAARYLESHSNALEKSSAKLASGNRLQGPGEDPAASYKSGMLESELRGNQQAQRNVLDARSLIQVAEGGLNTIGNSLIRLRELSIIAASDLASPEERDVIDTEALAIASEIDRIAQSTRHANTNLLNGTSRDFHFQVGPDNDENHRIVYSSNIDVTASTLGVDGLNLSDPDSALSSLEDIDAAIMQVNLARAQTGAFQNRLNTIHSHLQSNEQNTAADLSRTRDTDMARESMLFVQREIQMRAAVAVLAQANASQSIYLKLLEK